jgi:phosphomevalonate kinase
MRVFAPGKLVLTGAYAVLEGAPAIVLAVSRGAYADSTRVAPSPTPEVRAALGDAVSAPHVDASAMFTPSRPPPGLRSLPWTPSTDAGRRPLQYVGSRKLGLGASAAIVVASIASRAADAGADLGSAAFRKELFVKARAAHAAAQGGGSGVDVAASVHGGSLQYVVNEPVKRVELPKGLRVQVFACGTSARTSELRADVDRLASSNPAAHRTCMKDLSALATDASRAIQAGDPAMFVETLRRTARALNRLGAAAQVGIVPAGFDSLEAIAEREAASFSVCGAGGGDVAAYVGSSAPSPTFVERAHALGLFPLDLSLDNKGVRIAPRASAFADVNTGVS